MLLLTFAILTIFANTRCSSGKDTIQTDGKLISFYEVPLVCGADTNIGCGSRIKPLFIETGKQSGINESWTNRKGTVIAIVWDSSITDESEREKIIMPLFEKNNIEATLIRDQGKQQELVASFKKDKWYQGMDVDQLSLEEAEFIASTQVNLAKDSGIITEIEADTLKKVIADYFKVELVKVRTLDELSSEQTRAKWMSDIIALASGIVGQEKVEQMLKIYHEQRECKENSSCDKKEKDCCKKE